MLRSNSFPPTSARAKDTHIPLTTTAAANHVALRILTLTSISFD
jgi:hypothetical protein